MSLPVAEWREMRRIDVAGRMHKLTCWVTLVRLPARNHSITACTPPSLVRRHGREQVKSTELQFRREDRLHTCSYYPPTYAGGCKSIACLLVYIVLISK